MPGGQPVFLAPPQYAPQQAYAIPQQGHAAPQRQQPTAATPQPSTARGQSPSREQPRPRAAAALTPLTIPTPEQMGVGAAHNPAPAVATAAPPAPDVDWASTRKKIQELGAVSFRLDQLQGGRARFQVWLPGQSAAVQADGACESDAVRDCLDRARTQLAMTR